MKLTSGLMAGAAVLGLTFFEGEAADAREHDVAVNQARDMLIYLSREVERQGKEIEELRRLVGQRRAAPADLQTLEARVVRLEGRLFAVDPENGK
ncbi:hypothetical protein [Pseudophaeobacter sp.]|uniref:hypothetical protein n=1 Tax=Pseudophaeobacter sp. TaxID=1971739 RepID=UPI0032970E04